MQDQERQDGSPQTRPRPHGAMCSSRCRRGLPRTAACKPRVLINAPLRRERPAANVMKPRECFAMTSCIVTRLRSSSGSRSTSPSSLALSSPLSSRASAPCAREGLEGAGARARAAAAASNTKFLRKGTVNRAVPDEADDDMGDVQCGSRTQARSCLKPTSNPKRFTTT